MPGDIEVLSEKKGSEEDADMNRAASMSFREWIRGRCVYDCAICNRRFYDR